MQEIEEMDLFLQAAVSVRVAISGRSILAADQVQKILRIQSPWTKVDFNWCIAAQPLSVSIQHYKVLVMLILHLGLSNYRQTPRISLIN